ncbi:transcription factor Opi1-domain-containing protein, partial [Thelephora terrestris]
ASSSTLEQDPLPSLDDQDESVRIAVKALGDMRNSRPLPSTSNSIQSFSTPLVLEASSSTPPISPADSADDANSVDFVARVSTIPLVNTALRAYEHTKASSRVVKYGAEMMESSVKTISRPVIGRLPVTQLDEFACRQLDRFGRYGGGTSRTPIQEEREDKTAPTTPERESGPRSSSERERNSGSTPTPGPDAQQHAVVQRSRWQAMLLEAGGLGAAVSEESMRRLQYCLQWLQYATNHIDAQILILRDFMASLQAGAARSGETVSHHHMRTLNDVKRDVVDTIRQVVDIVSKYAGGALPEPARQRVRGFILHLPQRWASAARQAPEPVQPYPAGAGKRRSARHAYSTAEGSSASNPYPTPSLSRPGSPTHSRNTSLTSRAAHLARNAPSIAGSPTVATHGMSAIAATQAAQRILTLATESLDMIRGVTGVFRESLDRADAWVERLKVVGFQRQ